MAITTLDGLIAGLRPPQFFLKTGGTMEAAGVLHSFMYTAGMPGAATAATPGLGGAALTSYAGQIPFTNPTGGAETRLARFSCFASIAGRMMLLDRLWHNSGITATTTTAQTVNSVAWPARDRDGSTDGVDVLVALEVSTATTNGAAVTNTTMSYTNQAGTSGRTATIASFPATAAAGTFVIFQLQAGDTGVRSIQSVTLGTSYGGGTTRLVAFRILAAADVAVGSLGLDRDAVALGAPKLYDNTVPFLVWLPTATTAANVMGQVVYSQG